MCGTGRSPAIRDVPDDKTHLAKEHLDQARRLIEGLPRGEQQHQLLDQIREKEKIINDLNAGRMSMFSMFDHIFSGFSPPDESEFWEDEYED